MGNSGVWVLWLRLPQSPARDTMTTIAFGEDVLSQHSTDKQGKVILDWGGQTSRDWCDPSDMGEYLMFRLWNLGLRWSLWE